MADYNINAITRRVAFDGSSGLGPYAFTFEVLNQNDVAVYFNTTLLTITTDYTVTVNANGTGSVTIVTGSSVPSTPIASDSITIVGARDIERVTDFVTAGDLLASSLNEQLDALTIFDQQISEENARSLRAPVYDPELVADGGTLDMTLPKKADRAGKLLQFNSTTGNPEVVTEIGDFKGDWAASTTYSARDIVKDTSTNNIFIANTAHTSSGSEPLTTNADSAKWDLLVDAASATTSASTAATSASDAQKLAINAEDSQYTLSDSTTGYSALHHAAKAEDYKNTALIQASNALDYASDSTNARAGSIAARNAAFLALDDFDDIYLGSMADSQTQSVVNTTATWVTTVAQETQITVNDATGISVGMVITSATGFLAETNVLSVVGTTVYLNNVNQTSATNQAVTFTGHGVFGNFDGTKDGPSTNNDGSALAGGELYYNSTDSMLRYYNSGSSSWDDVTLSSANLALVNTVAGQISPTNNLATVAGIDSEITTVAGINATHLSNVSGVATEVGRLGTADAVADINVLGTAATVADMDTLADRATDIALLADIEDGTTATNAIQTVAANVSGVTSFAEVYRSGATDPTTGLDEGDLFFNTTSDTLKVYNGTAWEAGVTAGSGFLPLSGGQLTGNLTFSATQTVDGRDVSVDGTKLDGIEAGADVTDTTNVTAAGALMDSEVTNLAQVKAFDSADYATAAQGTTADAALPKTGGAMTGAITTNSTFDGRDVSVDGTKLDGIEAGADVTDATNVAAAGAAMLTGATFTGAVVVDNQLDIEEVHEKVTVITSTSGTLTFDTSAQGVVFGTANQTANRTINFSNVNSTLAIGQSVTCAVMLTQGTTAYYLNAYQVDGSSVTPKWQGGTAPTAGNASSIDAYSFTIIKTADATFTVLASQTAFA